MTPAPPTLKIAKIFQPWFRPKRIKVAYGGRGGAKSWMVADALIALAHTGFERIGCFRELQNSIKDSVHKLLKDRIAAMGLDLWFDVTLTGITSKVTGSEFLFKGLQRNASEIKSMEGITRAWVEEAQLVSKNSWELLIPTIRAPGSEIWVTFNPDEEEHDTYQRFIVNRREDSLVIKVGWQNNPWFPPELDAERRHMLAKDPEAYANIWEGEPRKISDAVIFKNRYTVECFEPPEIVDWRYGADFGFADDPATLIEFYLTGEGDDDMELWIHDEAYEYHVENDEMSTFYRGGEVISQNKRTGEAVRKFFRGLPNVDKGWPIGADSARPETISMLARAGFNIRAAEKWAGSVEDGVSALKGFKWIHIHERCTYTRQEFRLYSYKIDPVASREGKVVILPVIVDKHNHCIDGIRYGLDGYIQNQGTEAMWEKLGR